MLGNSQSQQNNDEFSYQQEKKGFFSSAERNTVIKIAKRMYSGEIKKINTMFSAYEKLVKEMNDYLVMKLKAEAKVDNESKIQDSNYYKKNNQKPGWGLMYERWAVGTKPLKDSNRNDLGFGIITLTCCDATFTTFPASDVRQAASAVLIASTCEGFKNNLTSAVGPDSKLKVDDLLSYVYENMKDISKHIAKEVKKAVKGKTKLDEVEKALGEDAFIDKCITFVLKKINKKFGIELKADGKGNIKIPKAETGGSQPAQN